MTEARIDYIPADRRPEFVDQGVDEDQAVDRVPRNPFIRVIFASWILFFSVAIITAICAGIAGVSPNDGTTYSYGSSYDPSAVGPLLLTSAAFVALGVIAGLLHLAIRALQWKSPELGPQPEVTPEA